jgi:two-component system nitrate/nitrite response regulator NarL
MVADVHPVVIEGIQARIASETDLMVVHGVTDLGALANEITLQEPAVALVGFNIWQTADPETALGLVRSVALLTRVIQIDPHQAWRALHAGVVGLISRTAPADQFVFAIRQTLRDGTFLDPAIQEEIAALARHEGTTTSILLTRREQLILRYSADGLGTHEIALQLALSPSSIKAALHRIYEKLGVHDRPAAVAQALRLGLIT